MVLFSEFVVLDSFFLFCLGGAILKLLNEYNIMIEVKQRRQQR